MVARLIIQTVVWLAAMAAVMFIAAGTIDWPGAWIWLGEFLVLGLAVGLWLARHDPALLAQRLGPLMQREQKWWDKAFMAALMVLWWAWLVIMAVDARHGWSQVAAWLQAVGALALALCIYMTFLTFRANSYAAPVVKLQKERGQHVVTTGPYRYVRHPMYAGALLLFVGTPMLLGSWLGLAAAPLLIALLAVRAVLEERMLADELDGYRDYAARVRYRLVPLVW